MVTHRFTALQAGERLDAFLAAQDLPVTRSQWRRHIDEGRVTVNGETAKPARKLRPGDDVVYVPAPPEPSELVAEELPLTILYEDRHLIAIDKPAGLVVHPAAGHRSGTLVNALLHHCRDLAGIGGELRPGIVHRLDRDTTGVLVVAKDEPTHNALSAMFKKKDLLRVYNAVVAPPPRAASGTVRTLYGRHPRDRKKFSSRVDTGKPAVTHWRVLERFPGAALVECRLETGRTHQIRVHMADSGWPVLGDKVYGRAPAALKALADGIGRQALHAAVLRFKHPITGEIIDLHSELPADMQQLLASLRG